MDIMGHCFPSTKLTAERTRLTERSVCTHLDKAVVGGWISRGRRQGASGQGWKRNEYRATTPKALKEVQHLAHKGTEGGSARSAKGTEPYDGKALKEVQSNQSVNQEGEQTEVSTSVLRALEEVCLAMGTDWDHKRLTPEQWVQQKAGESRFVALDFTAVFSDAADYLSSARCTRKYTAPSLFLLRQLKTAAERKRAQGAPSQTGSGHAKLRDVA